MVRIALTRVSKRDWETGMLVIEKANESDKCALVTGATGAIGPMLIRALCDSGWRVKAVARNAPLPGLLPENVEFIAGDVTQSQFMDSVTDGVTVIFHLAAKLHLFDPPANLENEYERVNVAGAQCVIESAKRNAVRRIVYFSTINVYGSHPGVIPNEDFEPRPAEIYAQTKLRAEQLVLKATRSDGKPIGVVLRLAAVYGPRLKGNYLKLIKALDQRRFFQIGPGNNRRALIHESDIASAALIAASHPAAANRIFNVSDGSNHSFKEILQAICAALGRKPPRLFFPAKPVRALIGMQELAAGILGAHPPITRALLDKYLEDAAVDATRIQQELGFAPQFDLVRGWEYTIKKMKQCGEI
jgi:nucleoside-diphosphate-sugar epimerase